VPQLTVFRLLYAKGSARSDGREHVERLWKRLSIVMCEALVQNIDVPTFGIHEQQRRATHTVEATIYITKEASSSPLAVQYLMQPLAAYWGVPELENDIRSILECPQSSMSELLVSCLSLPELPLSWVGDAKTGMVQPFGVTPQAMASQFASRTSEFTEVSGQAGKVSTVFSPSRELRGDPRLLTVDDAGAIMALVDRSVSQEGGYGAVQAINTSATSRATKVSQKRGKNKNLKYSLQKFHRLDGDGEWGAKEISAQTLVREAPRLPFSWQAHSSKIYVSSSSSPAIGTDESSLDSGFAGEYFVNLSLLHY
jgi:hypothetical protein